MALGCIIGIPGWESWNWRFTMCLQSLAPPMNYQTQTVPVIGKQIDVARNEICEAAIKSGAQHLLFLDTDVIFPPNTFQQLLLRQKNNPDHKVVTGVYWSKSNPTYPLIFEEAGCGSKMDWVVGDYIKADYAIGMGLVLINTDVLREIEPPWFQINYGLNIDKETGAGMSASITEDLYFCEKATAAGFDIWVDTGIQAGHLHAESGMVFGLNSGMPQAEGRPPEKTDALYIGQVMAGGEPAHILSTDAKIKPTWVAPPELVPASGQRYRKVGVKDVDITPEAIPEAVKEWARVTQENGSVEVLHPNHAKMLADGKTISSRAVFGPEIYEQSMETAGLTAVRKEDRGDYWMVAGIKPQSTTPLVSIIVVAHDLLDMTTGCIASLRQKTAHTDFNYEIVLVDNGSETPLPPLGDRQIRLPENLSFGKACHEGVKAANSDSIYLLFLNNDTAIIEEDWLANLLERIRGNGRIGIIGPKQLMPQGTVYHTEIGFGPDRVPFHLFNGFAHDHRAVQEEKEVLALNFGCALVRREAFEKLDGFDEQFGLIGNYEDIDFCLRARKAGLVCVYTPSSEIIHFGAQTQAQNPEISKLAIEENREKFVQKWKEEDPALFGLPPLEEKKPDVGENSIQTV